MPLLVPPHLLTAAAATVAGADPPSCAADSTSVCGRVWDVTHNHVLAANADAFIAKPGQILLILVVAFLVRYLGFRAINRVVHRVANGRAPEALRLRSPARTRLLEVSPLLLERRRQRAETIGSVLRSITSVTVFSIAAMDILAVLGINLAPIVASAGIVGVAVGFGAQNLVRDFLSGMFMILEDQYGVGDVIDAGPASGVVEAVSLRVTRLRDVNGVVWHVRNGEITRIGNSSQGWSRALLDVSVAYGSDLDRAQRIIKEVADGLWQDPEWSEEVLEEPEVWGVEHLGADGVDIRLVVKTVPLQQWKVARELRRRLKRALDDAGIEIPYPQRTVWLRSDGPAGAQLPELPGQPPAPPEAGTARPASRVD